MPTVLEKVEQEALSLPQHERAFLADILLGSLEDEALGDVDAAWIVKAERRYIEYKERKRHAIPAAEVFRDADRLFK